jgi:hypothetical protein
MNYVYLDMGKDKYYTVAYPHQRVNSEPNDDAGVYLEQDTNNPLRFCC